MVKKGVVFNDASIYVSTLQVRITSLEDINTLPVDTSDVKTNLFPSINNEIVNLKDATAYQSAINNITTFTGDIKTGVHHSVNNDLTELLDATAYQSANNNITTFTGDIKTGVHNSVNNDLTKLNASTLYQSAVIGITPITSITEFAGDIKTGVHTSVNADLSKLLDATAYQSANNNITTFTGDIKTGIHNSVNADLTELNAVTLYQSAVIGATPLTSVTEFAGDIKTGVHTSVNTDLTTVKNATEYQTATGNITTFEGEIKIGSTYVNANLGNLNDATAYQSATNNITTFTSTIEATDFKTPTYISFNTSISFLNTATQNQTSTGTDTTFTQTLILPNTAETNPLAAITKQYVDNTTTFLAGWKEYNTIEDSAEYYKRNPNIITNITTNNNEDTSIVVNALGTYRISFNSQYTTTLGSCEIIGELANLITLLNTFTYTQISTAISNSTYAPGYYTVTAAITLTGSITLNGPGIYVFKIVGAFTADVASAISLTGGAEAKDVFFLINGAITTSTNAIMKGTFISILGVVTIAAGLNLDGRIMTGGGAVNITGPITGSVPIGTSILMPGPKMPYVLFYTEAGAITATNGGLTSSSGHRCEVMAASGIVSGFTQDQNDTYPYVVNANSPINGELYIIVGGVSMPSSIYTINEIDTLSSHNVTLTATVIVDSEAKKTIDIGAIVTTDVGGIIFTNRSLFALPLL
jgi:hypothetical protein